MKTVYFCFCGRCHIEGVWTGQSQRLWGYLHQQVKDHNIEIRIVPELCDQCRTLKEQHRPLPPDKILIMQEVNMRTCLKCGTVSDLTRHHIIPRHHWHSRKNTQTICLCGNCHRRIETIILAIEAFIGHCEFGERHRLDNEDYHQIAEMFIHKRLCSFSGQSFMAYILDIVFSMGRRQPITLRFFTIKI